MLFDRFVLRFDSGTALFDSRALRFDDRFVFGNGCALRLYRGLAVRYYRALRFDSRFQFGKLGKQALAALRAVLVGRRCRLKLYSRQRSDRTDTNELSFCDKALDKHIVAFFGGELLRQFVGYLVVFGGKRIVLELVLLRYQFGERFGNISAEPIAKREELFRIVARLLRYGNRAAVGTESRQIGIARTRKRIIAERSRKRIYSVRKLRCGRIVRFDELFAERRNGVELISVSNGL